MLREWRSIDVRAELAEALRQRDAEYERIASELLRPRPTRIHWKPEPLTRDTCEVCGLPLYVSERVEVTATFKVSDPDPLMGGLGGITATYCTEHAPEAP